MTSKANKAKVVIIGANFAGLIAASKINKLFDVTVVDSRNHFQWTPNIHEILSDVKKDTSLRLDLATVVSRLGHKFIHQSVAKIDANKQKVTLEDNKNIDYDVLLIASGHTRNNMGVKGAQEHALGFRSANEVMAIHHKIEALLQQNAHPININIVGGGFTGVEVLGELLRKYANNDKMHINIIEAAERLVPALPQKLSADIVQQCKNYRVNFLFKQSISNVASETIEFPDGSTTPSDITIWTAGTKLPDYLDSVESIKTSMGLLTNDCLQSQAYTNVFVAGDSASLSKSFPKQASIALDMGLHAAHNINQFCENKSLKPFNTSVKPILLALGDINTYFVQGKLVLASPLLASAKEAVYQLWMARLSTLLPVDDCFTGLTNRLTLSTEKLLLPELLKLRPRVLIGRSKLL